jgi:acyl carrier protein
MKFEEFCAVLFSLLEQEPVSVSETTSLRDDLGVDSLQMVNLITDMADRFDVPFDHFIENVDKLDSVGGVYEIVKGGKA